MTRQQGMTLIELLVALAMFALIALAGQRLLTTALDVRRQGQEHAQQRQQLARAMALLESDLEQAIVRPVQLADGHVEPALLSLADGSGLQFTRAGWDNPLQQSRSNLQRVRWWFDDKGLQRGVWMALERSATDVLYPQQMLGTVSQVQWRYLDGRGNWLPVWPAGNPAPLPRAVEIQFTHPRHGVLRRVLRLPDGGSGATR